ncbi:glycoside hydrolase family 15 protein [Azospirillum sp. TSO22-1]|uniref:glycoside hydrolase family 15 protein n=1 Tax=Azospirillum sp. TSO22-1 TaxID=716789 RepID=UPI000D61C8D6|nr:glycoside hydrolase family 15 protein [Azospirillum sp. TSO22-1]PWC54311.1 glucoamylase [Azospirillum sp. TSO22-1]
MARRIEDYALIGNTHTAALVGRDGAVDWLCLPRFDSEACFAALLGAAENGRWRIAPDGEVKAVRRRYLPGTLVLETEFETAGGTVALIDFMPPQMDRDEDRADLVRIVEGRRGRVDLSMDLVLRFGYGAVVPWVRRCDDGLSAIAGPDAVALRTPVPLRGEDFHTRAAFTVAAGERTPFTLIWHRSHLPAAPAEDPDALLAETEAWWRAWSGRCRTAGPWREAVERSLITLKGLTYGPTGGIAAAATTSLPEKIGGERNWDYRFCWLRDSAFTLYALLTAGYREEAEAWRHWLVRAVAGMPAQLQIMYGLAGERRLDEWEVPWLAGFEGSRPVRIGNGAHGQCQLDVYGEVLDTLHIARRNGLARDDDSWRVQRALLKHLETVWHAADHGLWEVRGPARQFTHSKVMAWVAFDRAVQAVEQSGVEGPVERWRELARRIHAEVCEKGFDAKRNSFVQYYGAKHTDAALLLIPQVGFLPPEDPRVVGTIEAVERELSVDGGLLQRYPTEPEVDGLPPGEGCFLACAFWLVDAKVMLGRHEEARELFERLLELRNDVGLLAEEYDPVARRQLGNVPQAFSHVALVNSAHNLARIAGPARKRAQAPGGHEAQRSGD